MDFVKIGVHLLVILVTAFISVAVNRILDPTGRYYGFFVEVKHHARDLFRKMEEVELRMKDVEEAIIAAEEQQQQRHTHEADGWVRSVKGKKEEVNTFEDDYNKWLASNALCRLWLRYGIAKRAAELLDVVLDLQKMGSTVVIVGRPLLRRVLERDAVDTVDGLESNLKEVVGHLQDSAVKIVGIFGMGGVGKTTLLTMINNKLAHLRNGLMLGNTRFEHVVWATVSRDVSLESLQADMARTMGISLPEKGSLDSSAKVIFSYLEGKSFLLLLDDLWARLDLGQLGIPNPLHGDEAHRRKVVFTTRSEDVCSAMEAQKKIKVNCLSKDSAWELFRRKLGESFDESDQEVRDLAKAVAEQCRGLPIALIVIGRAMSSNETVEDWESALQSLKDSEPTASGMEDRDMFPVLKRSYDSLKNDRMRQCFLCCSLWPEDFNIEIEELIECWMGLGLINREGIDTIFADGAGLIQSLKKACLLELGMNKDRQVKMHDVIRDMALQIASTKWIVKAGAKLNQAPKDVERWAKAERVSLMHNNIEALSEQYSCPDLFTLMLQHNRWLYRITEAFFSCMPTLTYLNLSGTAMQELPGKIGALHKLQYLNISFTPISSLPPEIVKLKKLRYLLLRNTDRLSKLPDKLISSLPALCMLDLYQSKCTSWETEGVGFQELDLLNTVGITVRTAQTLTKLSKLSNVLIWKLCLEISRVDAVNVGHCLENLNARKIMRELRICACFELVELKVDVEDGASDWSLPKLKILELSNLLELQAIVWRGVEAANVLPRLSILNLSYCPKLKNVNWVFQLPCLQELRLAYCGGMEVVVDDREVGEVAMISAFPKLKKFQMSNLPKLNSICSHALAFPCLESINVTRCLELKRLPFKLEITGCKLQEIEGSQAWWEGLEWDDDRIKAALLPYFRDRPRILDRLSLLRTLC